MHYDIRVSFEQYWRNFKPERDGRFRYRIFNLFYCYKQMILKFLQLEESLNILSDYCRRWKLTVNVAKTKVIYFRKGGMFLRNLTFYCKKNFKYPGIVFTVGWLFHRDTKCNCCGKEL